MKGSTLLVFTGALIYLVRKLFAFVKALQAIQYVILGIRRSTQFLLRTTDTIPGSAFSFHQRVLLAVLYPQSVGLVMGAIHYSRRNINVSVCNPHSNHTLVLSILYGQFISRLVGTSIQW